MKGAMLPPLFFSVRLPTLLAMFWRTCLRPDSIAGTAQKEPASIIIFRLDSLGDVVLTTPVFRELKKAYPKSRCTVVVQEAYRTLLVTNPHVDEVLGMPDIKPRWLPQGVKTLLSSLVLYWTRLHGRRFDWAVCPRWDTDEHLATFLCLLTNASRRVGYSRKISGGPKRIDRDFDAAFTTCLPLGSPRHEVLRNLAMVEALGGKPSDNTLEIRLTEPDRRRASQWVAPVASSAKLIAIGIGAHSPGRRWPLARYARTVSQLARKHTIQAVVVCSAAERAQAAQLAESLPGKAIIVSGARLREVCALLERCDLFIGNDSGCAHLAAAMACRAIVISRHPRHGDPNHFNSPVRFAPHGKCIRVLQPAVGLDGCESACVRSEPHCICSVTVDDVVTAAGQLLQQPRVASLSSAERLWPGKASSFLLHCHSADAIQRAVEALHARPGGPPAVLR